MRSAPSPTASAAAASSALTLSGPCGERRDDRDPARGERVEHGGRGDGLRVADEPELRHLPRAQADLVAHQAERARADRARRAPR